MADRSDATAIRHAYGASPEQFVLEYPGAEDSDRIAVLVHGGYWRQKYGVDTVEPLAADLLARGWRVYAIEYRRVGSGGEYPVLLDDAAAAITHALRLATRDTPVARTVLIGHSVGGQIALLNAGKVDRVVGLAPVTDTRRVFDEHLGDDAAREFLGAKPDPEAFSASSPVAQLPLRTPALIVHGADDDRVPAAHARDYVDASLAAGDDATVLQLHTALSHMAQIDTTAPHWPSVCAWIAQD